MERSAVGPWQRVFAGQLLKGARLAINITQQDLAEIAGVSRSTVSQCERGVGSVDSYLRIATAFGKPVYIEVAYMLRRSSAA